MMPMNTRGVMGRDPIATIASASGCGMDPQGRAKGLDQPAQSALLTGNSAVSMLVVRVGWSCAGCNSERVGVFDTDEHAVAGGVVDEASSVAGREYRPALQMVSLAVFQYDFGARLAEVTVNEFEVACGVD